MSEQPQWNRDKRSGLMLYFADVMHAKGWKPLKGQDWIEHCLNELRMDLDLQNYPSAMRHFNRTFRVKGLGALYPITMEVTELSDTGAKGVFRVGAPDLELTDELDFVVGLSPPDDLNELGLRKYFASLGHDYDEEVFLDIPISDVPFRRYITTPYRRMDMIAALKTDIEAMTLGLVGIQREGGLDLFGD